MNLLRRTDRLTVEDFCALVREDQKADLINGVIYLASPDNDEHHDLYVWQNSPEPDIAFVRQEWLWAETRPPKTRPRRIARLTL
jgi:Uma2 family endonuclease